MNKNNLKKKLNYYFKVRDVMNIYKEKKDVGLSNREILRKYISPVYKIEETSLYLYLNINYEKEIKNIQEALGRIELEKLV